MVLNGESTHPNPWKPPSDVEKLFRVYQPYHIHQGFSKRNFVPRPNALEDSSFYNRVGRPFLASLAIGSGMALHDIMLLTQLTEPRAQIARYLYIAPPIAAVGTSYVCAKDLVQTYSGNKTGVLPYFLAGIAPGSIYGLWRGKVGGGILVGLYFAMAGMIYKESTNMGFFIFGDYGNQKKRQGRESYLPYSWKWGAEETRIFKDPGPEYEKWEK